MPNVDEDVGHTVLHFLYTGGYETVSSPLDEGASDIAREYKRSVLVYYASRTWGLTDLEILAKQKMKHLDEDLPILEILRVVRDVFSSLPADETWLPSYIRENLQRLPKPEDPGLDLHEFYNILGQDHQFDNAVMKMILEMLSIRLCSMKDQHAKTLNGIISEESPLRGPSPEDPKPIPEEPGPEPVFEEPELEPVLEEPEPEPVFEEPELEPVLEEPEPEHVFEEPEPEPEIVLEGSPAEGGSEQWIIPQVSADADGWSRASLLPGDTSNAEILPEATDKGHIARISCSDLSLSRGLPVPSETSFISIVTA
ncbi:hypothetical protein PENSOL_c009G04986 [Penicillium solitum]|uniref:BTB domain-containing protein n=1 Tax=Penicillium solitum TaxID=60172 RepID=A0A1V6RB20_9EURO|nr:uncharacterized protein PENSOL_c009G04986 [Penicillium solitum]OQD98461.1 hypothetical protein PENSOL_c009G04986 [Penicillium solitum]